MAHVPHCLQGCFGQRCGVLQRPHHLHSGLSPSPGRWYCNEEMPGTGWDPCRPPTELFPGKPQDWVGWAVEPHVLLQDFGESCRAAIKIKYPGTSYRARVQINYRFSRYSLDQVLLVAARILQYTTRGFPTQHANTIIPTQINNNTTKTHHARTTPRHALSFFPPPYFAALAVPPRHHRFQTKLTKY